jgi:Flp pilus assembly pilin Flp
LTITEYAIAAGLIAAAIAASFAVLGATVDAILLAVIAFL